jgi:glutamate synthase domain-containing protein 2
MTDPDTPLIAARKPATVELRKGDTYHWCRCGRSGNQPFCDGSHKDTKLTPLTFTAEETGKAFLCACKHTKNPPFCDGTHAKLPAEETAVAAQRRKPVEPFVEYIHELARNGLDKVGHHGEMGAMGVPRSELPSWGDIQILTAQLARQPLLDDVPVKTELIIGPKAAKPLQLKIPLLVSDMSFGALSEEAKVSLAKGAELAGTGICSGEGGMLPEEQAENSRYFYELASAKFGYSEAQLEKVQAFHFKAGQAAKTGTGGHLPGIKVTKKIAEVRGIETGEAAVSPATFRDFHTPADYKKFADRVREITGGIPIGFKMSANHIEPDITFALEASADYIIMDGRGGGTGAAPLLFRNNISVPTIPALARARRYLDEQGRGDVTLIITGGLRTPADFVKALCLGADGIALANSAIQAVGCIGARMCNSNNCPAGIATQKPELRALLDVDEGAQRLARFLSASVQLMQILARACGHHDLQDFALRDLTTWQSAMAKLTGISFAGNQDD